MHITEELLRLKDIITHIFQHTNTGKLYKTSWEMFFVKLGLGADLNHIPTDVIQALATDSLVKSACLFLNAHHWSLQHDIQIPPLGQGDRLLMPLFLSHNPPMYDLAILNHCQLFLQVSYVSEICSGDGLSVSDDALRGRRFEVPHKVLSWPNQQRPGAKEWVVWQSYLRKSLLSRGLHLLYPLGKWLFLEDTWEWHYFLSQECLLKLENTAIIPSNN